MQWPVSFDAGRRLTRLEALKHGLAVGRVANPAYENSHANSNIKY
jgi:hypothetical protein